MTQAEQQTNTKEAGDLQNPYVRDYYNQHLQGLDKDYIDERWFSSKVTEFDYWETRKTLQHALRAQKEGDILEIGPGDGVWTDLMLPLKKRLALLDQSEEMIKRAQKRLAEHADITYYTGDFSTTPIDGTFDLIFAVRCFEYFENKERDVEKMHALLNDNGRLIIVTKNRSYVSPSRKKLHTGQLTKKEMVALLRSKGFAVEGVYATTLRIKSKFWISRALFGALHTLHLATNGWFTIPYLFDKMTESYTYVATRR